MMAYETLTVASEDVVGIIHLSRPDAPNALDIQLMTELDDTLRALD